MMASMDALSLLAAEVPEPPIPVNLQVGQKVSVLLNGNPTTGFSWMLAEALPACSPVKAELSLVARTGDGISCGAPTPTCLTICGVKPGKATVQVVYRRPWEKDRLNEKKKSFSVKVSPAGK